MATSERPVRPDPTIRERDPLGVIDPLCGLVIGLLVAIVLLAVLV